MYNNNNKNRQIKQANNQKMCGCTIIRFWFFKSCKNCFAESLFSNVQIFQTKGEKSAKTVWTQKRRKMTKDYSQKPYLSGKGGRFDNNRVSAFAIIS